MWLREHRSRTAAHSNLLTDMKGEHPAYASPPEPGSLMTRMTMMTSMRLGGLVMGSQSWTVAEAKAKFSEIIEKAMSEGPQTITRKGRTAAVVVGAEEWQRKTKRVGNLAEFFAASPLRGSGLKLLKLRRLKERPRKTNLRVSPGDKRDFGMGQAPTQSGPHRLDGVS